MKKMLFIFVVIFLTGALFAQKSNYEKYYEARDDQETQQQDSIAKSKQIVEIPVVQSNKPATIFSKHKETTQTQVVVVPEDTDVNVYVVEPFDYGLFYSPFAFSVSFGLWGYPYYGYPYYGYPYYGFYDPWYYPYWGYPYYGYGYGSGYYHPHDGDHGHGALGWHGYDGGYNGHHDYSYTGNKTFINSHQSSRRPSTSRTQSSYAQDRRSTSVYTRPEMSTRPKYNNTKSGSFGTQSRNSFTAPQRSQSRSYSTPRSSTPASTRSSTPASRSFSSPSHSSGSFGGSRSSGGSYSGGSRSSGSFGGSSGGHGRR